MPRIVYSPRYNIGFFGLERLHPFDSHKYGRAYRELRKHFGPRLKSLTVFPPSPIPREQLLNVHADYYLDSLRQPAVVARAGTGSGAEIAGLADRLVCPAANALGHDGYG
jgi:histone deacetylase 11